MANLLDKLHMQEIPANNEVEDLVRIIKAKGDDILKAVAFAFYYGRICGKQQDRKRRKKKGIHKEKIGFSYMPTAAESEQINRAYERGTGDHDRALENVYLLGRVHGAKSKQARQAVAL